jgi:hypothetical protein
MSNRLKNKVDRELWAKLWDAATPLVEAVEGSFAPMKRPPYFTSGENRTIRCRFADIVMDLIADGTLIVRKSEPLDYQI